MNRHPYDWFIHFVLCFIPIYYGWATWFVVLFVALLIEYEQKTQKHTFYMDWKYYIKYEALLDLVAGSIGIAAALLLRG